MPLSEDDDVVETVAAYGPDDALAERVLPRTPRGAHDFLDTHRLDGAPQPLVVDGVAVSVEVLGLGSIAGERFGDLSDRPLGGRRRGHVHVNDHPAVVREDDEGVQHPERRGRYGEEVARGAFRDVVLEEGAPRLRRRPVSMALRHVLGDRRLGDVVAEQFQFCVDPRRSPVRVLGRHLSDERDHVGRDRRTASPARAPSPEDSEPGPVPGDDGLGFHDSEDVAPAGPDPSEECPEDAVETAEMRPRDRSFEYGELLTKREVLEDERRPGAKQASDGGEEGAEDEKHGFSLPRPTAHLRERQAAVGSFSGERSCGVRPDSTAAPMRASASRSILLERTIREGQEQSNVIRENRFLPPDGGRPTLR